MRSASYDRPSRLPNTAAFSVLAIVAVTLLYVALFNIDGKGKSLRAVQMQLNVLGQPPQTTSSMGQTLAPPSWAQNLFQSGSTSATLTTQPSPLASTGLLSALNRAQTLAPPSDVEVPPGLFDGTPPPPPPFSTVSETPLTVPGALSPPPLAPDSVISSSNIWSSIPSLPFEPSLTPLSAENSTIPEDPLAPADVQPEPIVFGDSPFASLFPIVKNSPYVKPDIPEVVTPVVTATSVAPAMPLIQPVTAADTTDDLKEKLGVLKEALKSGAVPKQEDLSAEQLQELAAYKESQLKTLEKEAAK